MKKRVIKKASGAVPCDHPDGGRLHIFPMTFEQAMRWAELATAEELVRDGGKVLFEADGKRPVTRSAFDPTAHIDFAMELVDAVEGIEFEEGVPFERTPENMRQLLTLMGEDEVQVDVAVDKDGNEVSANSEKKTGTKKIAKKVRENLFTWVTRKSAELAGQLNAVAQGN